MTPVRPLRTAPAGVLAAAAVTLLLCTSCRGKSDDAGAPTPSETEAEEVVIDAGPVATAEEAVERLRRFADAVFRDDLAAVKAELRVPPDLVDSDLREFLRELVADEHLSRSGVDDLVAEPQFGTAQERFGELAAVQPVDPAISAGALYALGDEMTNAVFVWDGTRLWVLSVLNLAPVEEPEVPERDGGTGTGAGADSGDSAPR